MPGKHPTSGNLSSTVLGALRNRWMHAGEIFQEFTSFITAAKAKPGQAGFLLQTSKMLKFPLWPVEDPSWEQAFSFVGFCKALALRPAGLAQPFHALKSQKRRDGELFTLGNAW